MADEYSEQSQAYMAYKLQSAKGAQASGAGGQILRSTGGQGGRMSKASTESQETRQDGNSTRGRHGIQKTSGAYDTELSIGNVDDILEAMMRGTWEAALAVSNAEMSSGSVAVGANSITASAGSWVTAGLRVGDVLRLSSDFASTNQDRNIRIDGLTATVITTADTLTVEAGPIAAFTVTRIGNKLINPAAGSLIKRYFTIDEHEIGIDSSEVFTDCVWTGMGFSMAPNGLFMANPSWTGTGQFGPLTGAPAPLLTSPSQTTGLPMAAIDATLRMGGEDTIDLTSFSLTIDTSPDTPDVVASKFAPDVFGGTNVISMDLTMLRSDLLDVADFVNESELSLSVLIETPGDDPKDFISVYIPNFTLGSVDKSAIAKSGGARTHTISVPGALVGIDQRGGAFDPTMIKFQRSNA